MVLLQQEILQLQAESERWSAEDVLRWGVSRFQSDIALASSFGAEDVVLIHLAQRVQPGFRVFTLDTDFLFLETYALMDEVSRQYKVTIEHAKTDLTPQEQARLHGEALWSRDPNLCCNLRKVEPLKDKLKQLRAWVTGVRRDQAPTRANTGKLEWDAKFGLVKLNPLADWTSDQVWDFIGQHNIPYNPLHDQNYPSIGCTHCTRPVMPGEDPRAGRWSGFGKTECGLHHGG